MKILIGIDTSNAWREVANLLVRLFPKGFEAELVHCVESILPDSSFPEVGSGHVLAKIMQESRAQAEAALKEAETFLSAHHVTSTKVITQGSPNREILEHADKTGCSLIAIRSVVKSDAESIMFGSTAKAVVISAKQSVLVVKNSHSDSGQVNALIATDHSKYMGRCIDLLNGMDSIRFGKLTVFTTNEADASTTSFLLRDLPDLADYAPTWIKEKLIETNEKVAADLAHLAEETSTNVAVENAKKAIPEAMGDTNSELLIMGAHGHNFFERILLGSQSMHQILNETSSVLLLRP